MQTVSSMNKTWLQCSREAAQFPRHFLLLMSPISVSKFFIFFFHALQPKHSHFELSNELNPPDVSYFHICTPPPLNKNQIKIPLSKVQRNAYRNLEVLPSQIRAKSLAYAGTVAQNDPQKPRAGDISFGGYWAEASWEKKCP